MYTIVVYDTAVQRNSKILRACRRYLHHVQCSVFEGELSPAQMKRFQAEVESGIDRTYDNVLVYTFPPGTVAVRQEWGVPQEAPGNIL